MHSLKKEGLNAIAQTLSLTQGGARVDPQFENLVHAVDSGVQYPLIVDESDENAESPDLPQSYTLLTYFIEVNLWHLIQSRNLGPSPLRPSSTQGTPFWLRLLVIPC